MDCVSFDKRKHMSRRFKSSTFKFNQPLSTPESKVVYHCYASHGKGYGKCPTWGSVLRILCINEKTLEVKWCDGRYGSQFSHYECDELRGKRASAGWRRLGWVMDDGSLPHGELDVVDPLLTQIGYLPSVDTRDTEIAYGCQPSKYWLEH